MITSEKAQHGPPGSAINRSKQNCNPMAPSQMIQRFTKSTILGDQPRSGIRKIRAEASVVGRPARWLWTGLLFAVYLSMSAIAAERTPENQIFQFSQSGEIVYNEGKGTKKSTLYLWIPEECQRVRGLVIMGTNVPEHMLVGHESIRRACSENNLALIWAVPTFWHFAKEMKGREAEQVAFFQTLINGLASKSGYDEIATVPWLPVGESGHLLMVCGLIDQRPEHCIAGICVKNPHYPQDRTVPLLWTLGTAQEWGQKDKDIRKDWNVPTDGYLGWVQGRAQTGWPLSILIEPATGHFFCTDAMAEYFGQYITAAVKVRLADDGSLKPVDLNTGFLAHLPLPGIDDPAIIPYADASPEQRKRPWFFTKELARAAQVIATTNWQAETQLVGFTAGANGEAKPFSFNSVTEITVTTDGEFEVKGTLLDAIPEGFIGAGEKLSTTPGQPVVEWICGPFAPTADGKFRVALDRTWKTGAASYLIGRQDGTATVRPSVQPAAVKLLENKEGAVQKITFDPVGPLRPDSAPVTLSATSDAGLPVEFVVLSGPAIIQNGQLVLTPIPPKARFPVEVTVAAWQWGRASEPKIRTADMVRQTVSIAQPGAVSPSAR